MKKISSRELAKQAGVSHTAVLKARRRGLPDSQILAKAEAKLKGNPGDGIRRERGAIVAEGDISGEEFQQDLRREQRAKAERREMENAARRGEMVRADDVLREWSKHIETAKNRLLLLPAKLAPRVAGIRNISECHLIIEREITAALVELGGYVPE